MYDSEIQELLYDTITGDSTLMGYVGGTSMVRLEEDTREAIKVSATNRPIVIECLPRRGPIGNKNEFSQRALIHVYIRPKDREAKEQIINRLSALFHNYADGGPASKVFTTTSYRVFTRDGGVDKNPISRDKQAIIFYLEIKWI